MSDALPDLVITGCRVHNLRDVSVRIPRNRLTVFTGVSGSGKSSLAFGTVAAESQRQLNETFTWFVRNRLPKHEAPDAEAIGNLSPAIVVDQKPIGGNARSTVGTMTDIHAVLRVLFSRHGTPSAGGATAYSFNDPAGMCPECDGLGRVHRPDLGRLLDVDRSLDEGAIRFPQFEPGTWQWQLYARSGLLDPARPLREFTAAEWELLLRSGPRKVPRRGGSNTYEGLLVRFVRLYVRRDVEGLSARIRDAVRRVVVRSDCPECGGERLNAAARATRVAGHTLGELCRTEAGELAALLEGLDLPGNAVAPAAVAALRRIVDVGLGHLTLDRETSTLSGGEAQRLKTVRHLGSSLIGMTYVFDEPTVGLHPADVGRLGALLLRLRDRGNTVLVVEHNRDVIELADHVVDLGPGAGEDGGRVVFEGPPEELREAGTPTGRALRAPRPVKAEPRPAAGFLTVSGARTHNLRGVSARFPRRALSVVTGVAGSGKSSLVLGELAAAHPEAVVVGQRSIPAGSRSVPLSFLGVLDGVRRRFAAASGADPGLFSFNAAGGCPGCRGRGVVVTDLAYLDPVSRVCEECGGHRYRPEALRHRVAGLTIAEVLELPARRAAGYLADGGFDGAPRIAALVEAGLGHLQVGRALSTLSGGERQRVKLAAHLHERGALLLLDEPTTGLHMADVAALIEVVEGVVDRGATVVVVEHDLDVVRRADWVVDLGPGGGRDGGRLLYEGPPSGLASCADSVTGAHLARDARHVGEG